MEEPPTKKIKVLTEDCFTNAISIENIPKEVLCIIFSHLDRQSVKNVTATCKLWLETIRGDPKRSSHVYLSTQKSFTRRISQKGLDKRIGDLEFPLVRWPVLKTIEFRGYYSYLSTPEKILQHSRRLVESENCPTLEKIIVSGSYNLNRVFSQFPSFGTIEEFTFSPRADIKSLQIEHITSLEFGLCLEEYDEVEGSVKISNGFKLIGETACNLKEIAITIQSCSNADSKECFKKDFCQMVKQLTLLQRISINVPNLWYMQALYPDLEEVTDLFVICTYFEELRSYDYLTSISLKFKKIRKVYIQVRLKGALSIEKEQWMRIQLPATVDQIFQDITEVKIVFYRSLVPKGNVETCFTVTKMPHYAAESSDLLEGPRPMKYTMSNRPWPSSYCMTISDY